MRNIESNPVPSLKTQAHRAPTARPLIIERPDLQRPSQRAVSHVMTALFWMLWVVLWLPLITLLGWAAFGYQFHFHMIALDGYRGFLDVLGAYGLVILVMGGGLLVWAKYNHLRFRGMDRRRGFAPPSTTELARVHGTVDTEVARWQSMNIVTVHHEADGRIASVNA